jgi:hypothetical protein
MKTAKDAQKGDRVWVKRYPTRHFEEVVIDNPEHWTEDDDFNEDWGYLADNETVIGGQLVKPGNPDLVIKEWGIGHYHEFEQDILEGRGTFLDALDNLKMNDGDMQAIQDHVRKHSGSAAPKKRTAADARVGDPTWVKHLATHEIIDGVIEEVATVGLDILAGHNSYSRYFSDFGIEWGFPEDRPDTQKAKRNDATKALPGLIQEQMPAPKQPGPQFGNVRLLIKSKGADWVKANLPDAWKAYKDAEMEKVRQEGDRLSKPGPLAGKTPRLQ